MTRSRWPRREKVARAGSWVSKWPKRCAVKGADEAKTLASTACGCACKAEQPSYASFYRETKISKDEWLAKLKQVRAANNILASDECAWITGGASGTTCSEHFGFDV